MPEVCVCVVVETRPLSPTLVLEPTPSQGCGLYFYPLSSPPPTSRGNSQLGSHGGVGGDKEGVSLRSTRHLHLTRAGISTAPPVALWRKVKVKGGRGGLLAEEVAEP